MAVGGWKGQEKGARGGRVGAVDGFISSISLAQNLDVSYFMALNETQCIPNRGRFTASHSHLKWPCLTPGSCSVLASVLCFRSGQSLVQFLVLIFDVVVRKFLRKGRPSFPWMTGYMDSLKQTALGSRTTHIWLSTRHGVVRDTSCPHFAWVLWAWREPVFDPPEVAEIAMLFRSELKTGIPWKGIYFIDQWLASIFMTCFVLNMIWKPPMEHSQELLSHTSCQKWKSLNTWLNSWGCIKLVILIFYFGSFTSLLLMLSPPRST